MHFLQLHAFEDWCQQKTSNVSKWTDHSWPSLCIAPHVRHPCLGTDHASSSYNMLNITGVIPRADAFTSASTSLSPFFFHSDSFLSSCSLWSTLLVWWIISVLRPFLFVPTLEWYILICMEWLILGCWERRMISLWHSGHKQVQALANIPNHEFVAGDQSIL